MKNLLTYSSLLLSVMVVSCNSTKTITTNQGGGSELLYLSQWKLAEVQGIKAPGNNKAFLAFAQGEKNLVTGNTGCNRVNGSFELSGLHGLKFSPLATTRMACLDETTATLENKFLDAMTRATEWWADSVQLLLKNGDSVLAKFTAQKALTNEQSKLNGTWELNFIHGSEQPFEILYADKKPNIVFSLPTLHAGGNSSCNGYGSEMVLNGSNISFKDPISTMIACPGNGEQLFFKTLKTITSFKVDDNNSLTLYAGNVAAMRFTKK